MLNVQVSDKQDPPIKRVISTRSNMLFIVSHSMYIITPDAWCGVLLTYQLWYI